MTYQDLLAETYTWNSVYNELGTFINYQPAYVAVYGSMAGE